MSCKACSAQPVAGEQGRNPRIKEAKGDIDGAGMPTEVLVELPNGDGGWYSFNAPYGEFRGAALGEGDG